MSKYKKFFSKKNIVGIFLLAIFFVLDRYFKFLSVRLEDDFYLVKNVLKFTFYPNKFISFSLPLSGPFLNLLVFVLIIFILINIIYLIKKEHFLESLLWLSVFLGAFSNFIDRIKLSFVIDYLEFLNFSVFNLADAMIVLGCFFIILVNLKKVKK
jgi:signal peptidase II